MCSKWPAIWGESVATAVVDRAKVKLVPQTASLSQRGASEEGGASDRVVSTRAFELLETGK